MAKKTTAHNTGLSITRKANKFTASWKIAAKEVSKQEARYRIHNGTKWGKWTNKKLSKKSTSFSFTLSAAGTTRQIQVQTRILRAPTTAWKVSDWSASSATYAVQTPPAPTLTVRNDSANRTTFSWSIKTSDTDKKWFYRAYYRTKCTNTPESSSDWTDWTYAADGSYSYTDETSGTTRVFQIKAVGPGGESAVQTEQHYIGPAPEATWSDPAVSYTQKSSYYEMTYAANLSGTDYMIDEITPQYYIGPPAADMSCPDGAGWTGGTGYSYTSSKNDYALAITTDALIGEDECLFARVMTEHDSVESYSEAYRVITGKLAAPTANITMGTPAASGFSVTISDIDAGTEVPGAYIQVYLERASTPGYYTLIGEIRSGTSATIASTEDITGEDGYSIHIRNVTSDGSSMVSDFYTYSTSMPTAPSNLSVKPTTASGKVHVSWTNNWTGATGTEIAWTDDPDNWMSNDEPEIYTVNEKASGWYITGLDTGKVWYFRVRSVAISGDSETYSPWSEEFDIDLASAPAVPVLYLSEEVITEEGMVTAYWSYITTDGTSQISGEVVEAAFVGGEWIYGDPVGVTTDAQHVDIYAKGRWTNGDVVYLALRTRSGSGGTSDYSTPVKLTIAALPSVSITGSGFASSETITDFFEGDGTSAGFACAKALSEAPSATVDGAAAAVASYSGNMVYLAAAPAEGAEVAVTYHTEDDKVLDVMPLTFSVTSENAETISAAIERAEDYPMRRPDGEITDGPAGETIYLETVPAADIYAFSVEEGDLLGRLDDGAYYDLVVTATDNFGQTAEDRIRFTVHWNHQAWVPAAVMVTDTDSYIVRITPQAATGYAEGDTCDIYRLGADKPELIYSGAEFGTEYVDPYPAFGSLSGYKLVTVTANGDYITDAGGFADYDTTIADNGSYEQLDPGLLVIDFDGDRVELPYNITLGNSWTKDFERTAYLGGHVAGDYNRTVLRDTSIGTVLVRNINEDIAAKMRSLASYAGICHVRTPEGSSFAADVQVQENRAFDSAVIEYSLSVQKADTVGFDGMTYEEWSELQ